MPSLCQLICAFVLLHSCDEHWGGLYCDEPETPLPTQLKDNFNRSPSNQNWLTVNGGKLSTVCGAVASGMALHFSGVCVQHRDQLAPFDALNGTDFKSQIARHYKNNSLTFQT